VLRVLALSRKRRPTRLWMVLWSRTDPALASFPSCCMTDLDLGWRDVVGSANTCAARNWRRSSFDEYFAIAGAPMLSTGEVAETCCASKS